MKLKLFSCFLLLLATFSGTAQVRKDSSSSAPALGNRVIGNMETRQLFKRKGQIFFYWGYNRSAYTKSDIHFSGDGYDFSITDLTAEDEPTTTFITYIKPTTFTVPQYNYRIGYFINDKTFISLGEDHMKYSINKQTTHLTGSIAKDNNQGNNTGRYNNTEVLVGEGNGGDGTQLSIVDSLRKGFVSGFEHCDGLNDVSFELGRIEQLWISKNGKDALAVVGSIGAGMVFPDSDVDMLGYPPEHDANGGKNYHLAGYSFSASFGLQFDFCKNFFLLTRLKGGYMNLPDINTTTTGGKASQHFSFIEPMLVVGYTYAFGKH